VLEGNNVLLTGINLHGWTPNTSRRSLYAMRDKTRIGAAGGALFSLASLIWTVVGNASTADDLFAKRGRIVGALVLLLQSPWTGAMVSFAALLTYSWKQQKPLD
jgi:putative copper export protein